MPIQSKLETLHFKDEDGNEIPDATFTIRRLSHAAADEYRTMSAGAPGFEELVAAGENATDEQKRQYGASLVRAGGHGRITAHLLKHGLIGYTGVVDANGKAVPVDKFQDEDDEIVGQVVHALQERLAAANRPNAQGRSATS